MGQGTSKQKDPDLEKLEELYRKYQQDFERQATLLEETASNLSPDNIRSCLARLRDLHTSAVDIATKLGSEGVLRAEAARTEEKIQSLESSLQQGALVKASAGAGSAEDAAIMQKVAACLEDMTVTVEKAKSIVKFRTAAIVVMATKKQT